MPKVIERLITRPRGLLLVTGPTGSGKTTSLASMINFINDNYDRHIITMEDPIEYLPQAQEVDDQSARDRRRRAQLPRGHPPGLAYGPRHHPRRRNAQTSKRFTRPSRRPKPATSSSARCTPAGPPARSTASSTCSPRNSRTRSARSSPPPSSACCRRRCCRRSPKGLVAAYEMMVVTPAIQNLIRENKTYRIDSSIQTGRKHGMFLLDESLFKLWRQGLVEKEEVLCKARKARRAGRQRIENGRRRGSSTRRRGRGGRRGESTTTMTTR